MWEIRQPSEQPSKQPEQRIRANQDDATVLCGESVVQTSEGKQVYCQQNHERKRTGIIVPMCGELAHSLVTERVVALRFP